MFIKKSVAFVLTLLITLGLFLFPVSAIELPEQQFPEPQLNYGGASVLTEEVSQKYHTQALRVYYEYVATDDGKVVVGNQQLAIKERGVLIKAEGKSNTELTVSNIGKGGVIGAKKTANFNECWNYNAQSGKLTFSVYVANLEVDDIRKISFRGYIVLENNIRYYTETVSISVSDIKNA